MTAPICNTCQGPDPYTGPDLSAEFDAPQWCDLCGKLITVRLTVGALGDVARRIAASSERLLDGKRNNLVFAALCETSCVGCYVASVAELDIDARTLWRGYRDRFRLAVTVDEEEAE